MNTKKNEELLEITQFELTKDVLLRLNEFEITPVAKLVLLYLTSCYNPANSVSVFPKVETIAKVLGLGMTATKSAIAQLINEGIVLKTKQKRNGNYNKYSLTGRVVKRTCKSTKTDLLKGRKTTVSCMNKKEEEKTHHDHEQKNKPLEVAPAKAYSEEEKKIIEDYVKNRADIVNKAMYLKKLLMSDCSFILRQYRKEKRINERAKANMEETKAKLKEWEDSKKLAVPPTIEFLKIKEKLRKHKNMI